MVLPAVEIQQAKLFKLLIVKRVAAALVVDGANGRGGGVKCI